MELRGDTEALLGEFSNFCAWNHWATSLLASLFIKVDWHFTESKTWQRHTDKNCGKHRKPELAWPENPRRPTMPPGWAENIAWTRPVTAPPDIHASPAGWAVKAVKDRTLSESNHCWMDWVPAGIAKIDRIIPGHNSHAATYISSTSKITLMHVVCAIIACANC
jgi:hypothetical protein